MSEMKVPALEAGVIRLFAIDLPLDEIKAFNTKTNRDDGDAHWPLKDALGAQYLDEDFVEVFPVSDLEGLGLSGYLMQGNDVTSDQIDPMRGQLDQLKGHVLLVFSSAFDGIAQTLKPTQSLRHIATFFTEGTPVTFDKLPDDSAQVGSGSDPVD